MSPRRFRPPALYTKAPFLKDLLDGMPDSVKVIDQDFRLVYANDPSLKALGATLNELRGRSCHQAFYGFQEKCFFCGMGRIFADGRPNISYCTLAVDGTNRDYEVSVFPLRDTSGKVAYAVEVVRDITSVAKKGPLPQNAGRLSSRDKSFRPVFENMAQWAEDGKPVMLQGEKGTGKKSFAMALHQRSGRSQGPFRIFHCMDNAKGGCSEGFFAPDGAWEMARGGTLYLDGICRLGDATQRKLAAKLAEPAPGDPRVVAATSEDLTLLVHKEVVRVDFYNHFASRVLKLPPLRERKQDLPFLAQHFIETYKVLTGSPAEKLGPDALGQLMSYAWPGNIRELETQIERSCLLAKGPVIERLEVEVALPSGGTWEDTLRNTEKAYLADLLTRSGGRLAEAAERSGLGLKTLQRRLKKHGLKPSDFRDLP